MGWLTYSTVELGETPSPVEQAAIRRKQYDTAIGLLEARIVGERETVREQVARILKPDLSAPKATATHAALLTLARTREGRYRLITTNFDRLFEHVIAQHQLRVPTYEAPLLPVPKNRWDGLVYLHGLLPENVAPALLDRMVLSSGDFGLAYLTERWAARFVSELFRHYTVCFVGYARLCAILRRKQVEARTGLSRSTMYDRIKAGTFPRPVALGPRAVRLAVSIGGDSDTLACMAGAVAEAFYGGVPSEVEREVRQRLAAPLLAVIDRFAAAAAARLSPQAPERPVQGNHEDA